MGQHRYNPTAKAALAGELPQKPPKMSKRERERRIQALIAEQMGLNKITRVLRGVLYG